MAATTLSVVMPAYNEEGAIAAAVEDVRRHVFSVVPDAELVVVNDGSRDGTGAILDRLAAEDARVRVIHRPNGGHGPALRTGLDRARGEFLLLIDSDRQIPLEAFPGLWGQARQCDAVLGVRASRHDRPLRLKLTALVRRTLRLLFGVRIRDANVPFKIVRRSAWLRAAPLIPPDTLAPSLFLALFLCCGPFAVAEQAVPHRERQTGAVSLRRWNLLRFCCRAFLQLLAFRRRLGRWHLSRTS
jgi:glycosyltransferase involved in cell wall biosynthesis